MDFLKRFGYFLVGLSLGSIAVAFFWKQKNVTFDYLPNARTLKNIRVKSRVYSPDAKEFMQTYQVDSATISAILRRGDVDFSKSKTHQIPCREYWVNSEKLEKPVSMIIENCDTIVTIQKVFFTKQE